MQTKLTLRIDGVLIEKAKRVAAAKGMSVSGMVARLIEVIPDPVLEQEEDEMEDLDPWIQSLYGVASSLTDITDEEIEEDYANYLIEKHK